MKCMNKIFIVFGLFLVIFYFYLYNYMFFCSWKWDMDGYSAQIVMLGDPQMEGTHRIIREGKKGEYNIWFNDNYFKHIVSNIAYFLAPSHVLVLGDLFSSQYIDQFEFDKRVERYQNIFSPLSPERTTLINITGNHDIGYGNEADHRRVERFERVFGKVNSKWYIAGHLLAVVNSINLDPTSKERDLYDEAWRFLKQLAEERNSTNTPIIIATHIPLYKDLGDHHVNQTYTPNIDAPYHSNPLCIEQFAIKHVTSYTGDDMIREQSMLTKETTQFILDEIKPAFVFNGHDHDGCIYKHNNNTIEYTIRSMMGEFGGYSALFEIKKPNPDIEMFNYSFKICPFIPTKFINISFGVTGGWLALFILYNILLLLIDCFCYSRQKYKTKKE